MADVKKPQRIDVSSYIEVISVKSKEYQKSIRTGEGNISNSLNDLAYRGTILSQNEQALREATQIPKSPTIQYAITNNVIPQEPAAISLKFVQNVFLDELLPQGFGEQVILDNCQVGTNIYYDGEVNTEYSELGWNAYAVDASGNYVPEEFIFSIDPVKYEQGRFALATGIATNQNNAQNIANPRIEQSYSNIPQGSETDPPPANYQLNQRISEHLNTKDIDIASGNNVYFKFDVHNDTSGIAKLLISLGDNNLAIDVRPGAIGTISTSAVSTNIINVSITAQTVIESPTSTLLFGVLTTQTNFTNIEDQKKYDTDIVIVDTRTSTYRKITDFTSAPPSIIAFFRDANFSFHRPIRCTIYNDQTKEIWWLYKRSNDGVYAEIFDFNNNRALWKESRFIKQIDQRFDIFDALLEGQTITILLTRITDDNYSQTFWNSGDPVTDLERETIFLKYNIRTTVATDQNLTQTNFVAGLRRFVPANKANEYFSINDDTIYRLGYENNSWVVKYKTTTRDITSTVSPEITNMRFPRVVTLGAEAYNTHRFRDIVYDKTSRKLYIGLQSRGTAGYEQLNGVPADSLSSRSIFIARCDENEILIGEQISPNPVGASDFSDRSVADMFKIQNKIYFSNADKGFFFKNYSTPFGVRTFPSGYYGNRITSLEIEQNGVFVAHDFASGLIAQNPAGSYKYEKIIELKSTQQLPEVGLMALTLGPSLAVNNIQIDRRIYISNFSLCYETIAGIEDAKCIGEDIAFNGQFKSGLAGWTTSGYVGLNGPSVEMSSLCQGYNEDPIISQDHFSGGPITPINTVIQEEDKIKLIVDAENISTRESEVYTTVNNKVKGFILAPGERRILANSNFVDQSNISTNSVRVKTYPKIKPASTKKLIAPISGDLWHTYGLFDNSITISEYKNADNAISGAIRYRYAWANNYVYTVNARKIIRSNQAESEIFYEYADTRVVIESIHSAGQNIYVIRKSSIEVQQRYYLDLFDTSTKTLLRSYDIEVEGDGLGLGKLRNVMSVYDAKRNFVLLSSSFNLSGIYRLDLNSGNMNIIYNILPTAMAVDPVTAVYYIAINPVVNEYTLLDTTPSNIRFFRSNRDIVTIDEFGNEISNSIIYRGDRPIRGVNSALNQYATPSPIYSLTCISVQNRNFILWSKNEPIVRNSTGNKIETTPASYGYYDNVGYNNQNFIYMAEYNNVLPERFDMVIPIICLHNQHLNIFSSLAILGD